MPWPAYLVAHTEEEHQIWWQWFLMHQWSDMGYREQPPDLSMDGCVPKETQERWMGKHQGAKFAILANAQRRRDEANKNMTEQDKANREAQLRAMFAMARESGVTFKEPKAEG